jgi:phosphate-selective porin OprO/OprP
MKTKSFRLHLRARTIPLRRCLRLACSLSALALLASAGTNISRAQETAGSALAPSEMILSSWEDKDQVVSAPATAPTQTELELAARVAALEAKLDGLQTAAAEEPLPPGDGVLTDECKEQDIIMKPTFTPIGRIYVDGVTYTDDEATKEFFDTDRDDEFGLRQFRIGGKGNIWENMIYNAEFEIRGGPNSITYKDIYIEQQNLPFIGHFRAGHFKEPIGLEEFGSDLFQTFMDKSPATHAFAPARNFGVMMWDNVDPCWDTTWFLGAFRADSPDAPNNSGLWRSDNYDWSYDARLATLPYYDVPSNGRYLVHLGGSYSLRHIGGLTAGATGNQNVAYSTLNGLAEFTTRSWVGAQGPIGFGSEADSDQWNQLNAEFLVIWGATSVQSEYFQLLMNSGETYQGGYAFLSHFLTGESRGYRKENKTIDRTVPYEPFFWVNSCHGQSCGWGAWELATGYSWVDLREGHDTVVTVPPNSTNRYRGFNNNWVIGVNWYQNPWSRVMIDYTLELVDFVDNDVPNSNASIWGMRWQVDW